jgi:glycosyltransferase involved in cell wall biosynthesis
LIEAFRQIETDFSLVIAGPQSHAPGYVAQLQQAAAQDERIQLVGSITGARKEALLSHAYLFVLPSEIEGLPVALLEACCRGVCPLISNIPTNMEVLGSRSMTRGFSFDPASTRQLQTALETCIENPELTTALGEQARTHVLANYGWDQSADDTRVVYSNVLEEANA